MKRNSVMKSNLKAWRTILLASWVERAQKEFGAWVVCEYRFHPVRKWRFDVAVPTKLLALEIEGGVYTLGRHVRPSGFLADMEKYNAAAMLGWRVFRCTWKEIEGKEAFDMMLEATRGSIEKQGREL